MMTNLPMPGEAQSPANYMKQVRLNAHAHICMHASCHVHVRMQVDHAACICNFAYAYVYMCVCVAVQVDTLVDSLPLCMLIMGQKNSDVVTMYS